MFHKHKPGFSFNYVAGSNGVRLADGCRGFFGGERVLLQVSISEGQLRHCHSERSFVVAKFVGMEENQIVAIELDGKKLAEGIAKTAQKKYGEGVGKMLTSVKTTTTKSSDRLCQVSATQACVPVRPPSDADKRAHPDCGGVAVIEIQLPDRLAPTHDLKYMEDHAVVRYFVRAELWANRKKVSEGICRIVVLGYDGHDPLPRTQRISSATKLRTSFFSKDRVELGITSKRAAFVGQKLPVTVKIDNQSRSLIQHLNITLTTRLNMRVKDKTSSSSTDKLLLRSTIAVAAMTSESVDLFVDLPHTLSSSTQTQHTTVSHELVVTVVDSDFVSSSTRCCLPIGVYHARPHTAQSASALTSSSSSRASSSTAVVSTGKTAAAKATTATTATTASPVRVVDGTGTIELEDGSTYSGPVDKTGNLTSGIGTLTYANGDSFRGIFSLKANEPPNPLDGVHLYANEPSSFEEIDRAAYPNEPPTSTAAHSAGMQMDLLLNSANVPPLGPSFDSLLSLLPHYRFAASSSSSSSSSSASADNDNALIIDVTNSPTSLPAIASISDLESAAATFLSRLTSPSASGGVEATAAFFDASQLCNAEAEEQQQQLLLQSLQQPSVLLFLTKSVFAPVRELTRFLDGLPAHQQSLPHVLLCRASCIQASGGGPSFDRVAEQLQQQLDESHIQQPFLRLFVEVLLFIERSQKRRWVVGRADEVLLLSERCLDFLTTSSESSNPTEAQALFLALQLLHVTYVRPYLNSLSLTSERFSDTGSHQESAAQLTQLVRSSAAFFERLVAAVPALGRPLVFTDVSFLVDAVVSAPSATATKQLVDHCGSTVRTPTLLPLSLDVVCLSLAVLSNEIYRAPITTIPLITFFFVTSVRIGHSLMSNGAVFGVRFFAVALRLLQSNDPTPGLSLSRCLAQAIYEIAEAHLSDNQATTIALALAGYCYRSGAIHDMLMWCERAILSCITEPEQSPATTESIGAASSSSSVDGADDEAANGMEVEEAPLSASSSSALPAGELTSSNSVYDDDGTAQAAEAASSDLPMQEEESSVAIRDLRVTVIPPETYGVLCTAVKLIAFKAPTSARTRRLCEQVLSFIRHSQTPDAPVCTALLVTLYDKLGTISSAVKERSAAIAYTRAAISQYEENEHLFTELTGTGLIPAQSYGLALLHLGRLAYAVGCNVEALEIAARIPNLMETVARSTLPNSSERRSILQQWKSGYQWADSMAKKPQRTLLNWQKAKQNPSTVYFDMFSKSAQPGKTEDDLNKALFHLQKTLEHYDYPCRVKQITASSERVPFTTLLQSPTPAAPAQTQPASSATSPSASSSGYISAPSTAVPAQAAQKVVQWVPDEQVTNCHCCNCKFGMFMWKHHCRACGQVVCDDCSPTRPLPPHPSPVRVCKKCAP